MSVLVNLASFKKGFPKDMPPPARLLAFGKWLGKVPRGALGYFDALSSEPLDVTYTDNAAATDVLRRSLGIFLTLCDGSRLALWNHGGKGPAVVLLGSEGELKNVAPDFDSFLLAWSRGKCGIGNLDEEHDDVESARPALAKWLAAEGAKRSSATAPSFKSWFKKTVDDASPAARKKKLASAASAALAKAERVRVDLASVRAQAPKGFAFPPRFEPFAKWLAKAPEGGLTENELSLFGYRHSMTGDDAVDAELRKVLVLFMAARDLVDDVTTEVGLWKHSGATPSVIARVDESTWRNVAPDLDTFLLAWASGETGIAELGGGDEGTLASFRDWLVKGRAKPSTARAPDIAAWVAKVRAEAKRPPSKKVGAVGKPPADMAERTMALLGQPKDAPAVVAFANELGIDLAALTDDSELNRLFVAKHGYSFAFPMPEDDKAPRVRTFASVRFHRAKNRWWSYALGRDVSFSEFAGALPRGLAFTQSRGDVIKLLGKPTKEDDDDLEWTDKKTGVTLVVEFASQWDKIPAGEMKCVVLRR